MGASYVSDGDLIVFVVDTDSYAGNFERSMVAWMTSIVGECGVGDEHVPVAMKEIPPDVLVWLNDNVRSMVDNHGYLRPASIFRGPDGGEFNSVAMVLIDAPPSGILAILKERAHSYPGDGWTPKPTVTGFRLLRRRVAWEPMEAQ